MSEYQYVEHEFDPVYNEESQVLVLGSLPSVKSREQGFYYGHPRNRFWKVMAAVLGVPEPLTIEEKKRMLLAGHVAVYDVIRACEIIGSSDSSIRNVVPADIESIVTHTPIRAVFTNGKTAGRLYKKISGRTYRSSDDRVAFDKSGKCSVLVGTTGRNMEIGDW